MRNAVCIGLLVFCTAGCSQPMGPIAGGALEGDIAQWPDDWTFTKDIENVLLETNPDDPYSVTVWGIAHAGGFYVAAAENDSQWVQHIMKNPLVRLSVEGVLYDGRAVHITDVDQMKPILEAYVEKYEIDYEGDFSQQGALFQIQPR